MVREAVNEKLEKVIRKAPSLLIEATTNIAETFMRIVVKFLGHKQVCRSKRNSHSVRVTAAALANSLGNKWHSNTYKSVFGRSPSKRVKNFSAKREKLVQCARRLIPLSYERRAGRYNARQSSNGSSVQGVLSKNDSEYGPNCQTPDLLPKEFEDAKGLYLKKMTPTIEQLKKLPGISAKPIIPNRFLREWKLFQVHDSIQSVFGDLPHLPQDWSKK
jgi:hypothetical protein